MAWLALTEITLIGCLTLLDVHGYEHTGRETLLGHFLVSLDMAPVFKGEETFFLAADFGRHRIALLSKLGANA